MQPRGAGAATENEPGDGSCRPRATVAYWSTRIDYATQDLSLHFCCCRARRFRLGRPDPTGQGGRHTEAYFREDRRASDHHRPGRRPLPLITFEDAKAVTLRAYELGINYFDCARIYWDGKSEEVYGAVLPPFRKNIFLTTKSPQRTPQGRRSGSGKVAACAQDRSRGPVADAPGQHAGRSGADLRPRRRDRSLRSRQESGQVPLHWIHRPPRSPGPPGDAEEVRSLRHHPDAPACGRSRRTRASRKTCCR